MCSVDLRPTGLESVCPGTVGPITCNLTWTSTNILRWDVDPNGLSRQTVFHRKGSDFSGTIDNVGEISIILKESSYVVSRLEVPDSQGLIPITVSCGNGLQKSEKKYIIQYKGKKCINI